MDISKLELKTYRGYKHICETIGAKYCSGKQKIIQLNEWRRFFDWTEHGRYNWEITKIYDTPKPKIDGRVNNGGARRFIYGEHIDYLILKKCNEEFGFNGTIRNIAYMFDIVNDDFLELKFKIKSYAKELQIDEWYILDFYRNTYDKIKKFFTKSLNRLRRDGSIIYGISHRYKDANDGYVKTATPELIKKIEKIEKELLNKMGVSSKQMAIKLGKAVEFYKLREKRLFEELKIEYDYTEYDVIVFNEENLLELLEDIEEKFGESFDHSEALNLKLRNKIIEWAIEEHENRKQEYESLISPDDPFYYVPEENQQVKRIKLDMRRKPEFVEAIRKCVDCFLTI
jgi:hypothetical protein